MFITNFVRFDVITCHDIIIIIKLVSKKLSQKNVSTFKFSILKASNQLKLALAQTPN